MSGKYCPLVKEDCLEHKCKFYIHLVGKNPQTGKDEDSFDCAIAFLPILLVENAMRTVQGNAAIEDFRNKTVGALQQVGNVMSRRLDLIDESHALPDPSTGSSGGN